MIDVAIVGSGPAGLSAALYAARAGFNTVVFEELNIGGQLASIHLLENYPGYAQGVSGFDFAFSLKEQAERFGAQIVYEKVLAIEEIGKTSSAESEASMQLNVSDNSFSKKESDNSERKSYFLLKTSSQQWEARSVIIATGARPRKLHNVQALALEGKGVSYCATCDGNFFKGKDVVVVGGGDTACADVLYLSRIAKTVHLVHRRLSLRANQWYQDKLNEIDNVQFHKGFVVSEIFESEGRLSGIEIKDSNSLKKEMISCSGLFAAIGTEPSTEWLDGFVLRDEQGYIISDSEGRTSKKGIYVAGDVRANSLRQVVTAASDGAVALSAAAKFLAS